MDNGNQINRNDKTIGEAGSQTLLLINCPETASQVLGQWGKS